MNANLGVQLFSYPFRHPISDLPLALGTVTVTLANTATLVATFADAALAAANPNPMTLDQSGYARMFFSPLNGGTAGVEYDVVVKDQAGVTQWIFEDVIVPIPTAAGNATGTVLGYGTPTTITIAGGVITPTRNMHAVSPEGGAADNLDVIATTFMPDGAPLILSNINGAAAITVRNGIGNIFTSDGQSVVLSATAQRLTLYRHGANWFEAETEIAPSVSGANNVVNGRLTLQSGVPVPTTDLIGALTVIYFTPYQGNRIALYNSTTLKWEIVTFSELSRAIPNTDNTPGVFDVFVYLNAGIATLYTDISWEWTNATTRAIPLGLQDGVLVLSGLPQYRYVGTIAMSATIGRSEDSLANRLVWNYYNRVRRPLRRVDTTASWTYSISAYQQARGSSANQVNVVVGVNEDAIDVAVRGRVTKTNPAVYAGVSVGLDSVTTPATGALGQGSGAGVATETLDAAVSLNVAEGRHALVWLERGDESGTTWAGQSNLFQAGISGSILA